jgi:hypothetical protein
MVRKVRTKRKGTKIQLLRRVHNDFKKRHGFTSRAFHYKEAVQDLIATWEGLRDTPIEEAWDIYSPPLT